MSSPAGANLKRHGKKPNPAAPIFMNLREVQIECDLALQQLEKLFKPHCRLTLLMRNPELADGDLLLTRDDLDLVSAALQKLKAKEHVNA